MYIDAIGVFDLETNARYGNLSTQRASKKGVAKVMRDHPGAIVFDTCIVRDLGATYTANGPLYQFKIKAEARITEDVFGVIGGAAVNALGK